MNIKNDLIPLKKEDYRETLDFFKNKLKKESFVEGLFQFGNIHAPGISDLDLIIVIDNDKDYERKAKKITTIIRKVPHYEYLIIHEPIIVPKKNLKFLNLYHSAENIRKIYGDLDLKQVNQVYPFNNTQILTWNSYFYQTYLLELKQKSFSLRRILLLINNMRYSLDYNSVAVGQETFSHKVKEIRKRASINSKDKTLGEEAYLLLETGLHLLRAQEKEIYTRNYREHHVQLPKFIFSVKKRSIFVRSSYKVAVIKIWKLKIFFLPQRYFIARNNLQMTIKDLETEGVDKKDYYKMRGVFDSVYLMDI